MWGWGEGSEPETEKEERRTRSATSAGRLLSRWPSPGSRWGECGVRALARLLPPLRFKRDLCIDNLLVRINFIIVMIRWTGLTPWEFESPFPGSRTSTLLVRFNTPVEGSGFWDMQPHRAGRMGCLEHLRAASGCAVYG